MSLAEQSSTLVESAIPTLAESTLPYPGELAAQDVRLLNALDRMQCEAIKWQQERNVLRALLAKRDAELSKRDAELAQLRAKGA